MIITRAEVKTYLGISSTTTDDIIDAYLPAVIDEFFQYTNNYFKSDAVRYSGYVSFSSAGTATLPSNEWESDYDFYAGDEIYVHGSVRNDGPYTISSLTTGVMTISTTATLKAEDELTPCDVFKVEFPVSAKPVIAQMIKFKMDNPLGVPLSERLGDYSVTYAETGMQGGYPDGIASAIKKYCVVRFV